MLFSTNVVFISQALRMAAVYRKSRTNFEALTVSYMPLSNYQVQLDPVNLHFCNLHFFQQKCALVK